MPRSGLMLLVYALTLFLSALLLFLVQPLIGKLIVPLLGGFPAVWNTCMVFFQAMLLAGYAYAHYSGNWLGERRQAAFHLGVLLLPAVVLPLGLYTALLPAGGDNPIPGLLLLLIASAGLPFFAIATTAPLLQRWFANTAHPAARDPYFLYAASNVGSMLALLGYPSFVEPYLTLEQQRWAWSVGYALLVLLLAVCAVLFWKSPAPAPTKSKPAPLTPPTPSGAVTGATPFRRFATEFAGPSLTAKTLTAREEGITLGRALRWVALAFVPSSLMLGVTTYITTDVAAIPLLWVLPLTLYLFSFIIVFSSLGDVVHRFMVLALPVLLLLLVFLLVSRLETRLWTVILLHLLVLFGVAMVCHGELARSRPAARYLTQFYLLMSIGGVLGGLFNVLVAPLIFNTTAEYPLALVFAALLIPRMEDSPAGPTRRTRWLDFLLPVALGLVCLEFFGLGVGRSFPLSNALLRLYDSATDNPPGHAAADITGAVARLAGTVGVGFWNLLAILCFAPPIILTYILVERPLRFGLGVAAILLASALPAIFDDTAVYRDRTFFGVLKVRAGVDRTANDDNRPSHRLMHGNILHGKQFSDEYLRAPAFAASTVGLLGSPDGQGPLLAASAVLPGRGFRSEPITYYHATGPMGQFFHAMQGDMARNDVAVIGLGTGTMAAYADPGQHYTFYEIDRKVKEISFDQDTYFSYVQEAKKRGAEVDIVLGDARLSLDHERQTKPDRKFDLIVVDAFSSDAIPVHLLTREALRIYRDKLKDGGIIIFHTSNKYLRLEPVVARLADDAGMVAIGMWDDDSSSPGKNTSTWMFLARRVEDFGGLREKLLPDPTPEISDNAHRNRWCRLLPQPGVGVWTDDYSNLLRVFQWKETN